MKMFRLLTGVIALVLIMLTGCSTQSPDFSSVLKTITITGVPVKPRSSGQIAVGDKIQFTASGLCTTPPGTKVTDPGVVSTPVNGTTLLLQPCDKDIGSVVWSVDNSGNGSIDPNTGLFTAGPGVGTVVVKGTVQGLEGTANVATISIPVTPVVLDHIVVSPKSPPPVAQNGTVTFTVAGVGSDGLAFTLVPASITWTKVCADTVATIAPTTGTSTVAKAVATTGTCAITANSADNANGDDIASDSGTFTINNDVALKSLQSTKLTPPSAAIAKDQTQDFQLIGIYGDGLPHPVPNADINWTVSAGGIASIADHATDVTKETATGLKVGVATITATLKDASTLTDPTKNSATGSLTVVDAACTTPLSNQNTPAATTATAVTGPLCLICGVNAPDNVIDADPTNVAVLNAFLGVGLPTNEISLTVNSNAAAPFAAGGNAGFRVTDPSGALLSANVLNAEIRVTTLLGGVVQETSIPYVAGGLIPLPPLLDITLLGLGAGGGAYVTLPTTKPFDALRVTFSTGLVSALSSVNVTTACAAVDKTKITP
ncbi:hypothetical protein [Stenotrophobium rhamnosiphilum]|uniref:BIG2 domain-containing protein n=1 Tax=Stenotrophobium rhamnosiphilum TaxID=2029166 RepID=A0A2T5MHE1_9GAMM|nr:hypothetical protein [Stenotrophobium rhamnosiphilum]PTU31977.1 hypothetical protein CJD38_04670 [Stenotrophobium rhamnosiphilum]